MRLGILLLGALLIASPEAQGRSRPKQRQGKPGAFDYYVLSLSWSPQFCATPAGANSREQCAGNRLFGFVVHGLWPQFESGWPENCAVPKRVDRKLVDSMLPLMPSGQLIQHEWDKHGTCSGLSQQRYFANARLAFDRIAVPNAFKQPLAKVVLSPAEFKETFLAANPALTTESLRIRCAGRFLSEVQVCFTKDLEARQCGSDVRDRCSAPEMIMRPVR